MDFLVGTFNHPSLYLLTFNPQDRTLKILQEYPALAGHSWLSLSKDRQNLYCTAWTPSQPSVAAYRLAPSSRELQYLNAQHVRSLPGYICNNSTHVFSVSGPSGEVFRKEADGSLGTLVQTLDFITADPNQSEARGAVAHGDFGGLRHGAHSADLSPDGTLLYVADIGRNCVWVYRVRHERRGTDEEPLQFVAKHVAPRPHDGPRHTWPHPNGRVLYSLQEHSSMVDVFVVGEQGKMLEHVQGCSVLPAGKDCKDFWADEVRYSTGPDPTKPRYLYASNRGLEKDTMGYVAAYRLKEDGMLESEDAIDIWETPTSGGIANAIEPAPWSAEHGDVEFLALCDSQEGWVSVLSFDGKKIQEVAKVNLGKTEDGKVVAAATPVWL
jgi:carboxy-cis,cis-muconate cyclase